MVHVVLKVDISNTMGLQVVNGSYTARMKRPEQMVYGQHTIVGLAMAPLSWFMWSLR